MTSATVAADDAEPQGSWLPLLLVALLLSIRWLYSGQGNVPVRIRRWANLQVSRPSRRQLTSILGCLLTSGVFDTESPMAQKAGMA